MAETSVLIRTKNEEKWVGECLKRLFDQTYRNFEVLILDSGSVDKTLDIVRSFNVRLVQIRPEEFTYPKALNQLAREARAEKYLCILSAHSLPCSRTWIADGIASFLGNKVAGVYGPVWALPDASVWEKLIFNPYLNYFRQGFRRRCLVNEPDLGVLGNTNALIRRDLWERHPFDETYAGGGEDGAWAEYWLLRGYAAVRDLRFAVYHSHGLGLVQLYQQFQHWKKLVRPTPFGIPPYRARK